MQAMRTEPVVSISTASTARARAQRNLRNLAAAAQAAATAAAPRSPAPRGGRAWLNGHQLGGPDARYDGLARAHD